MLSNLEELLERSIFHAIREKTVAEGYLPNINTFDVSNIDNTVAAAAKVSYENAKTNIFNTKGFVVDVFGVGNNQAKGLKKVPRIVVDTQTFQPGTLGGDTSPVYENVNGIFVKSSNPSLASDFFYNVYAVANNVKQLRVLTAIISSALPRRGYIKTYLDERLQFSGNILTVFTGSMDSDDLTEGVMEKVFSYASTDVFEGLPETITTIVNGEEFDLVPISEIKLEPLTTL